MSWRIVCVLLAMMVSGCVSKPGIIDKGDYQVDTRHMAPAAFPRVKVLVIHYTVGDFDESLATLTGKNVSVHYLIPARPPRINGKPLVWQLVPENELAWHAGVSFWRGATRINDTSVGIELVNAGFRWVDGTQVFTPFPPEQIAALLPLVRDIVARWHIEPQNVVAHADIAPQRKEDPGPLFPWALLAKQGIGAWPDSQRVAFYLNGRPANQPVDTDNLLDLLARYGYEVSQGMSERQKARVISAFQMHFRPARYDGKADAETQAIAEALLEKYH